MAESSTELPVFVPWRPLDLPSAQAVDNLESHFQRKMKLVDQQLLNEIFRSHPRTFRRSGSASPSPSGSEEDDDDFLPRSILRHKKYRRPVMPSATFSAKQKRHSKIVHFADSVGQNLESIHYVIHNELPPVVPASAFDHLKKEKLCIHRHLVPSFPEPGCNFDFLQRIHRNGIALEKVTVIDTSVNGIVRVLNVAFEKVVTVRYTLDEWKTYTDIEGNYVCGSNESSTDKFSFSIFIPISEFLPGQKLHFALQMKSGGREFWDNNDNRNYTLECEAKKVPVTQNQSWLHFM